MKQERLVETAEGTEFGGHGEEEVGSRYYFQSGSERPTSPASRRAAADDMAKASH